MVEGGLARVMNMMLDLAFDIHVRAFLISTMSYYGRFAFDAKLVHFGGRL